MGTSNMLQELADYWQNEYSWRIQEAKLNEAPQFKLQVNGIDLHFVHAQSPKEDAIPLLFIHGWPGSFTEVFKLVPYLTGAMHKTVRCHTWGMRRSGDMRCPAWRGQRSMQGKDEEQEWDREERKIDYKGVFNGKQDQRGTLGVFWWGLSVSRRFTLGTIYHNSITICLPLTVGGHGSPPRSFSISSAVTLLRNMLLDRSSLTRNCITTRF
jgi:hypothetical protein